MTADILLINPETGVEKYSYINAPLNLLYLSSYLEEHGYNPKMVDCCTEGAHEKIVKEESKNLDFVGISSMTGRQIKHGLELARIVRQNNENAHICWGGIHPTLLPQQTLEDQYVDSVVRGEGEATLLELIQSLENGKGLGDVKGLSYKDDGNLRHNPDRPFLDINELPLPAWHLLDVETYAKKFQYLDADKVLPIHTSRGCPHRCGFCYNTVFNRGKWRGKTPEKTIEEIQFIVDTYNADGVIIREDNFCSNKKRAIEVCNLIKENKFDIKWTSTMRANYFTHELLKPMVESGMSLVNVGAESGSPRMLKFIKKDISVEQTIASAEKSKKYDVLPMYSFVMGFPTETLDEIHMTIDLINKLKATNPRAQVINMNIYTPYPDSELYGLAKEQGFREPKSLDEWGEFTWDISNIPWIENLDIIKIINIVGVWALNDPGVGFVRSKNLLFNAGGFFMQNASKVRWKYKFWRYPLELKLYKFVKENLF